MREQKLNNVRVWTIRTNIKSANHPVQKGSETENESVTRYMSVYVKFDPSAFNFFKHESNCFTAGHCVVCKL